MNFKDKLKLRREAGQAYRQSKLDEILEILEDEPEVVEEPIAIDIPEVLEDISDDTPEVIEEPVFIPEPPKPRQIKRKPARSTKKAT